MAARKNTAEPKEPKVRTLEDRGFLTHARPAGEGALDAERAARSDLPAPRRVDADRAPSAGDFGRTAALIRRCQESVWVDADGW